MNKHWDQPGWALGCKAWLILLLIAFIVCAFIAFVPWVTTPPAKAAQVHVRSAAAARGSGESPPAPTRPAPRPERPRMVRMRVSAYCPCRRCCGKWADGVTASGEPVTANGGHFAAADRSVPFGTMLSIPGYAGGRAVPVLDRGGAIKGNRLDVFFPDHQTALNWGVRHVNVTIYRHAE